ncbi:hypothetical protein GCM10010256_28810 [Streptomyces coeruleorubidus]|nr:hypothetical protein GCM10010256_28810 [Streptomyces coeruleorubidus]
MQQPPGRARDERLELPVSPGRLGRMPLSHRASRPTATLKKRARPGTDATAAYDGDPVSYQARGGPAVKSRAPARDGGCPGRRGGATVRRRPPGPGRPPPHELALAPPPSRARGGHAS